MNNISVSRGKTADMPPCLFCTLVAILLLAAVEEAPAQSVITFNEPWLSAPGIVRYADYYEQGLWFRVVNSYQQLPASDLVRWSAAAGAAMPYNGTPFMQYARYRYDDHVLFTQTDGSAFGLVSVDLAEDQAPSLTPIPITFTGYRPGYYEPYVSVTFTTAGGGTSAFETLYFPPEFAAGLVRVEIPSTRWAMDNLVWVVPEPATVRVFLLGLLALGLARSRRADSAAPGAHRQDGRLCGCCGQDLGRQSRMQQRHAH
jgi:hypothetical protein